MLKASQLQKAYGDLPILKGVDIEVGPAELVSIVGASGAGKTTLLQILGTLDRPDSGQLLLNGVDPFSLSKNSLADFRNQHIGFVFQFHQLLPEFSALENAALPALIAGKSQKEAQALAYPLLERLGIAERAQHRPSELSGGEQQRVAVCRALINKPAIVFADEPSGNLDTMHANALHQLFFELRKELNQSFVIVTHNENFAQLADRCLHMKDGRFV
jgi:lipoprotein-releasing system ATP-binding protein